MEEMTDEERKMVRVLRAVLDQHGMNSRLHAEHHKAVAEWLARENRKRERWEKIMQSAAGGILVAVFGGIASALVWLGKLALAGAQHTGGNPPPGH